MNYLEADEMANTKKQSKSARRKKWKPIVVTSVVVHPDLNSRERPIARKAQDPAVLALQIDRSGVWSQWAMAFVAFLTLVTTSVGSAVGWS